MDLVNSYSPDSASSSPFSSVPSSPLNEPSQETNAATTVALPSTTSPATQAPAEPITKLVTGTFETISFDEQQFSKLERRLVTTGSTVDPRTGSIVKPYSRRIPDNKLNPKHPVKQSKTHANHPPKRPRNENIKPEPFIPSSQLHIPEAQDYQHRSWTTPASSARSFEDLETYSPIIPKKIIHSLKAHDRGVSSVQFSSPYGHLILTTGLDGLARVWSSDSATCMRSYTGHTKGIRDAVFNQNAETFLTAGYDRAVRLWDTETGRVIGSYATDAIPYCVRFSPLHDGKEFLVGCGNKKVIQIDVRDASKVVQKYDQHMGAVNSISFVDNDRRFISSSDDKVLRLWEYGVPVVIRHLSDPTAHSMPVTLLHPNRKSLACQSMDNAVRIFTIRDKFKPNLKKSFNGHLVAGYACGLKTSPDGRFLCSADSLGRLFFWDWGTSRLFQTLQGHKGVCIGVDWHPTRSSFVASCGWDGQLNLWD